MHHLLRSRTSASDSNQSGTFRGDDTGDAMSLASFSTEKSLANSVDYASSNSTRTTRTLKSSYTSCDKAIIQSDAESSPIDMLKEPQSWLSKRFPFLDGNPKEPFWVCSMPFYEAGRGQPGYDGSVTCTTRAGLKIKLQELSGRGRHYCCTVISLPENQDYFWITFADTLETDFQKSQAIFPGNIVAGVGSPWLVKLRRALFGHYKCLYVITPRLCSFEEELAHFERYGDPWSGLGRQSRQT